MYMTPETAGNRQYDIQAARGTLCHEENGDVNEPVSQSWHEGLRRTVMKRIVRLQDGTFGYEAAPTLGEQWDAAGVKGTSEVPVYKVEGPDFSEDTLTYGAGHAAVSEVVVYIPDDVSSLEALHETSIR